MTRIEKTGLMLIIVGSAGLYGNSSLAIVIIGFVLMMIGIFLFL